MKNSLFVCHPKFENVKLMVYAKKQNGEEDFFLKLVQNTFDSLEEEDFIVEKGEDYAERSLARASGRTISKIREKMYEYNLKNQKDYLVSATIALMDSENIYIFTVGETCCIYKKDGLFNKVAFVLGTVKHYFGDFGYSYEFFHLRQNDADEIILCESAEKMNETGAIYTKEKVKVNVA